MIPLREMMLVYSFDLVLGYPDDTLFVIFEFMCVITNARYSG